MGFIKIANFVRKLKRVNKHLVKFRSFHDVRGWLAVAENNTGDLPFQVRRVFWIGDVPSNQTRGCHAHRTCSEIVIPVCGSFKATITDINGTVSYEMDNPEEGLLVPPMAWCVFSDFSKNCICLCLASEEYNIEGYLNDFECFLKELR